MMGTGSRWSTSAFGHAVDPSPAEQSLLGTHLCICRGQGGAASGLGATLRCAAEAARMFVATHLVTALVGVALLIGVTSLAC